MAYMPKKINVIYAVTVVSLVVEFLLGLKNFSVIPSDCLTVLDQSMLSLCP